jgi:hypothetical protein
MKWMNERIYADHLPKAVEHLANVLESALEMGSVPIPAVDDLVDPPNVVSHPSRHRRGPGIRVRVLWGRANF